MVACAVVLFVEKREKRGSLPQGVMPMAKALTVAAVAGNIIACAAYLLAQRLYAADITGRASLTITIYFAAWLTALIHAGLRPYRRAWTEQLAVAAMLCLVLPIASIIAGIGLPAAIPGEDWTRAGVDLFALASGLFLGIGAWRVWRSDSRKEAIR